MGAGDEAEPMVVDERSPSRKEEGKREKSSHRSKEKSDKEHREHRHKHKSKDKSKDKDREKHQSKDKRRDKEREAGSERSSRREEGELEEAAPSGARDERDGAARRPGDQRAAAEPVEAQRDDSPLPDDVAAQPPPEAGGATPAAELPPGMKPQVEESGGEVSMSIEETNKMRIAMGLKPLKADNAKSREDSERAAGKARADAAEKKKQEAELRQKIASARDKRKMEAELAKTKTLGEADQGGDDVASWVAQSRQSEAEAKRAAERAAAARVASMYDEEDEDESEDEDMEKPMPSEMSGMRIKHSAEELGLGQTTILTLADRNILEEQSDDEEVLENVLSAEHKKREKARKAALKPGAEYDEDGKAKGMLTKYDEEEQEGGLRIGASGVVADEKARQQADIRRRLAEGTVDLATSDKPAAMGGTREYYTKEEMDKFAKPKKRVKKKLRKARAAAVEEDEEAGPSSDALAALEEAAAAEAADGTARDHGSRARGAEREAEKAAKEAAEAKKKRERYEAALQKANYATLAASKPDAGGADDEDEDDDVRAQLEASMRRSRAAHPKSEADPVAAAIIARREAEEAQPSTGPLDASTGGERLTEAAEFARLVGQRDEGGAGPGEADGAGGHMGVDGDEPAAPEAKPAVNGSRRSYRAAKQEEDEAAAMEEDEKLPPPPAGGPAIKQEEELFLRERSAGAGADTAVARESQSSSRKARSLREGSVGTGLAGTLELLKARGELTNKVDLQKVEWAGRTNDMKPVALQGLEEVYTGGRASNELANSVERALTRRDGHGRVLTPKEAWRELCHDFHGIYPSKNKEQRQLDKDVEMVKRKKAATSQATAGMRRLQAQQQQTSTPYVVLSGKVAPGQMRDPTSGYATATGYQSARTPAGGVSVAPTPVLGGGHTPLTGDRKKRCTAAGTVSRLGGSQMLPTSDFKVAAMLGMKRPGDASMPPPPMRKQRQG